MNEWQQFFDRFADRYDQEIFTRNSEAEVEFIIENTQVAAGGAILDLGCGTGRHSVPLAQRGYRVTGVDLSPRMLAVAAQRAQAQSTTVEWVQANAADFVRADTFDAVICLCEGAFCLLTDRDDPVERDMIILRNIRDSLQPGGTLILNVLNACRAIRLADEEAVRSGRFDPLSMTTLSDAGEYVPDMDSAIHLRERYYTATELARMIRTVGMNVQGIYGGTAGNWGLRSIELDEYELMAIAKR